MAEFVTPEQIKQYVSDFAGDLKMNGIKPIYVGKKKNDDFFSFYDETTQFLDVFFTPEVVKVKYAQDGAHQAEWEEYPYSDETVDNLFKRILKFMKNSFTNRDERRKPNEEVLQMAPPSHPSVFGDTIATKEDEAMALKPRAKEHPAYKDSGAAASSDTVNKLDDTVNNMPDQPVDTVQAKEPEPEREPEGNTVEAHEKVMPHTYRKMRHKPKVDPNDEVQQDVNLAVAKALAKAKGRDMGAGVPEDDEVQQDVNLAVAKATAKARRRDMGNGEGYEPTDN